MDKNKLFDFLTKLPAPVSTLPIFIKNYNDMNSLEYQPGQDNYFHAKANMQSAQRGGLFNAIPLDFLKEDYDILKKNIYPGNGYSPIHNIKDSLKDLYYDGYGLYNGIIHPLSKPQDALRKIRPKNLDDRF